VDHLGIEPSKDGLQGLPALQRAARDFGRTFPVRNAGYAQNSIMSN
jgi:hypothetical protein